MQKLTKEQRDWLIEGMGRIFPSFANNNVTAEILLKGSLENGAAYMLNAMTKLIDQCTEKEFPAFEIYSLDKELLFRVYAHDEEFVRISNYEHWIGIKFEEFKQFTEGCQKICEWLEGSHEINARAK
jgi:hypothetical protein